MKVYLVCLIAFAYIEYLIIAWQQGKLNSLKEEKGLLQAQLEINAHKEFLKSVGKDVK